MEEHDITIPNEERNECDNDISPARLFGSDCSFLEDWISEDLFSEIWTDEYISVQCANIVVARFEGILNNQKLSFAPADKLRIKEKALSILEEINLLCLSYRKDNQNVYFTDEYCDEFEKCGAWL